MMMKNLMFVAALGILLSLNGCTENEAKQKAEERKQKRANFIKPVDTNGSKQITKLPF
jgi:hypothetical protein